MTARRRPLKPPRPLGTEGTKTWRRIWSLNTSWIDESVDLEHVLVLCESMDERVQLRVNVLRDPDDWRTRNQLRNLDGQITEMISSLGLNPVQRKALQVERPVDGKLAQLRAIAGGKAAAQT